MITIMGIKARDLGIDLTGTQAEITKIMGTEPRRISSLQIQLTFNSSFDSKTQTLLERAALTCPVAHSLHPDLRQEVLFIWPS
jgi:organic hydroperoxide reductase OsmC/OhrA